MFRAQGLYYSLRLVALFTDNIIAWSHFQRQVKCKHNAITLYLRNLRYFNPLYNLQTLGQSSVKFQSFMQNNREIASKWRDGWMDRSIMIGPDAEIAHQNETNANTAGLLIMITMTM